MPVSDGWKRTPRASAHAVASAEARMVMRASASSVAPPVTRRRSSQYSASAYASVSTEVGAVCMARRLRVCRLLPPRIARGACSTSSTRAPASRAVMAAHRAALPPPITSTS